MRRRQLLAVLALGGAACAGWAGRARAWLAPAARHQQGVALLAAFSRPESAAAVGRAYLSGHPADADEIRLAADLADALRSRGCDPLTAPPARLRAAIADQIRADFASGQVVSVEGWVLSRSEARLCALAALHAPLA
jgi:hypothetical protein